MWGSFETNETKEILEEVNKFYCDEEYNILQTYQMHM